MISIICLWLKYFHLFVKKMLPGEEFPFNKQSSAAHKVGVFLIECIDSFSQTLNKYIADAPV